MRDFHEIGASSVKTSCVYASGWRRAAPSINCIDKLHHFTQAQTKDNLNLSFLPRQPEKQIAVENESTAQ